MTMGAAIWVAVLLYVLWRAEAEARRGRSFRFALLFALALLAAVLAWACIERELGPRAAGGSSWGPAPRVIATATSDCCTRLHRGLYGPR